MRQVIPASIREDYVYWKTYMHEHVDFSHGASVIHTKAHCERVLLYALILARKLKLTEAETTSLCHAAVYHDSRRHDDWLDVGHGKRAAEYYRRACQAEALPFYRLAYDVMAWHDHADEEGLAVIREHAASPHAGLVYQAFKDADALDRFRLGPDGLDVRYLRSEAARQLYDYAHAVWTDGLEEG